MTKIDRATHFAPELHIPKKTFHFDFYKKFGATEHFCFRNDDESIHVAELEINGAIFHVHETMRRDALEPLSAKGGDLYNRLVRSQCGRSHEKCY